MERKHSLLLIFLFVFGVSCQNDCSYVGTWWYGASQTFGFLSIPGSNAILNVLSDGSLTVSVQNFDLERPDICLTTGSGSWKGNQTDITLTVISCESQPFVCVPNSFQCPPQGTIESPVIWRSDCNALTPIAANVWLTRID
eukprot:TRINITY_DN11356_c0_g1_i1.p1 TRINITY_DN11356_c0_g1~~TRINITY_DN11356_c0_g1_i1.p1  ORF type:complete len:141 (-),score=4.29 TRINITY_DN11356_c0_g1_i1:43-465(-)